MDTHPELRQLRTRLARIHDAVDDFSPLLPQPPIIDSSIKDDLGEESQWLHKGIDIPGLKRLKEDIRIDLGALDKVFIYGLCSKLWHYIRLMSSSSFLTTLVVPTCPRFRPMRCISSRFGTNFCPRHSPFSPCSRCFPPLTTVQRVTRERSRREPLNNPRISQASKSMWWLTMEGVGLE